AVRAVRAAVDLEHGRDPMVRADVRWLHDPPLDDGAIRRVVLEAFRNRKHQGVEHRGVPVRETAEARGLGSIQRRGGDFARGEWIALDARDASRRAVERAPHEIVIPVRLETDYAVRHRDRRNLRIAALGREEIDPVAPRRPGEPTGGGLGPDVGTDMMANAA